MFMKKGIVGNTEIQTYCAGGITEVLAVIICPITWSSSIWQALVYSVWTEVPHPLILTENHSGRRVEQALMCEQQIPHNILVSRV
jgi:hypothetical protein